MSINHQTKQKFTPEFVQQLPFHDLYDLYTNNKAFQQYLDSLKIPLNKQLPIDKDFDYLGFPLHLFTFFTCNEYVAKLCLSENDTKQVNSIKHLFNNAETTFIDSKFNHRHNTTANNNFENYLKILERFTHIDPCYYNNFNVNPDNSTPEWNDIESEMFDEGKLHPLYPKHKLTDRLSNDINDDNCTLYLHGQSNCVIKNTTINHLILRDCSNITIESNIKGRVKLQECEKINIKQDTIKSLYCKYVNKSTFNNVGVLTLHGYSIVDNTFKHVDCCDAEMVDMCEFDSIDHLSTYGDDCYNIMMAKPVKTLFVNVDDDEKHVAVYDSKTVESITICNVSCDPDEPPGGFSVNICKCPNLKELKIYIDANELRYEIKNCENLEHIEINRLNKDNIKVENCPKFKRD